jgi:TolA-binding protein
MQRKIIIPFVLLLIISSSLFSQQSKSLPDDAAVFRQAELLFESEKYASARPLFESVSSGRVGEVNPVLRMQAAYFTALCAVHLNNGDAEVLLERFIADYPESAMRNQAVFRLGLLQFQKRNYRSALRSFEEVNVRVLSNTELAELYFKRGFCYLRADNISKARENFNQLRNTQTAFSTPATYYYAHIAYLLGENEKALADFERIKNERAYRSFIPFYIVHIHYMNKEYEQVIEKGTPLFTSERNRQNLEVGRMLADAHYRQGDYDQALRFFEMFIQNVRRPHTREESFQMGYLLYLKGRHEEAIRFFQPVTAIEDSLAQYAYYHLADAYIKTGQLQNAGNAFNSAYRLPFNPAIQEDALFNYARLALENRDDPYNESIRALNQYLENFPQGLRREEALSYLVHLYMTANNYRDALISIENIKQKDDRLKEAYQKITYFRGVELFNDRNFFDAVAMFRKSQENPIDRATHASSLFWTGEAYFRLSQYELAANYFNRFLNAPGARSLPIFHSAYYNLGYSHFQQKKYNEAIQAFNQFLTNEAKENRRMVSDARLRIGDSYFINKSYQNAIQQYDLAIRINTAEADYATFQKARAQGALGSQQAKIATLRAFERDYAQSPYAPEAIYEMGNTSMIISQNADALRFFSNLIKNYPNSNLKRSALMKTGLIHYNANDNTRALDVFKQVVKDYPGTPDAHESLANIRNIYVELNNVDAYLAYTRGLPFAQVTEREQDSLIYIASMNKYMANDCRSAVVGFNNYLGRYPNGFYSLQAHFYKADCEFRANNMNEALVSFEEVISRPHSEFTERALLRAARINQSRNNHSQAKEQFVRLEQVASSPNNRMEALLGQLNAGKHLNNHTFVLEVSTKLLNDERVPETSLAEIYLLKGKAHQSLNQNAEALAAFRQSKQRSPQGSFGAEATYLLAFIQFGQKAYTDAENSIFDLAANYASYDHWVASGFILLSDIYRDTGNVFQARQTLLSIIENHEGEELRAVARQKLNALPAMGSN